MIDFLVFVVCFEVSVKKKRSIVLDICTEISLSINHSSNVSFEATCMGHAKI